MSLGKPQKIYLATVLLWLVAVMVHGSWHIYSVLSGPPDSDLYANTVGFQIIAYAFVWLPWLVGMLFCVLLVEFVVFGRKAHATNRESRAQ